MLPYISQNCKSFYEKSSSKNEQPNKEQGNQYQLNKNRTFCFKAIDNRLQICYSFGVKTFCFKVCFVS